MNISHRLSAIKYPLATVAGLSVATLALHLRDPHESGSWGYCPTYVVMGFYCPGCGGLRAVNDLTNFRLVDAIQSNALLAVLILPTLGFLLYWLWSSWRAGVHRLPQPPLWIWPALIVLSVGFAIVRNFEFASFLQP